MNKSIRTEHLCRTVRSDESNLGHTVVKTGLGATDLLVTATAVVTICALVMLVHSLGPGSCRQHRLVLVMTNTGVMHLDLHGI